MYVIMCILLGLLNINYTHMHTRAHTHTHTHTYTHTHTRAHTHTHTHTYTHAHIHTYITHIILYKSLAASHTHVYFHCVWCVWKISTVLAIEWSVIHFYKSFMFVRRSAAWPDVEVRKNACDKSWHVRSRRVLTIATLFR